ncbi:long-chain fatty acid--CoA ligase [Arthrobacter sp. MYb214]|uniref:AMP-dependent synthetase/ligase n=2 Tax=Micrococcales TaxID=85006 RepID=UPI000CFDCE00|nr:AMP-dependent synthetase/ligase [Arthrobacter sp. MYb222]PQZ83357.1 long-chain fatty acid--CoA ligase [Arthrobacter sp. MYb222]PRB74692.1 long-chain fatty acid--CoA ligase [Arthrobacter sp. MYb214]
MREFATPLLATSHMHRNATDLLMERLKNSPEHIAFEVRSADGPVAAPWKQITTREFFLEVQALAKGLIASGLQPGNKLVIMSPTRYEWAQVDMAAWFAGAVVVPIYETSSLDQVTAILADCSPKFIVAGSTDHASILERGLSGAGICGSRIWTMDTRNDLDLEDLVDEGKSITDGAVEERRLLATSETIATIVYTSGTTAAPKGALITHGNLVGLVLNVAAAYTEVVKETGNTIIFLPMAHVLARGLQLICLANGMRIAHLSEPKEVIPSLEFLKPTFLVVVPRVLQKIQDSAAQAANQKRLNRIWKWASDTATQWGAMAEGHDTASSKQASPSLRMRHFIFDRIFYSRLRKVVGGRLEYLLSGAATLDREVSLFFRGIGLPVIEGYGLTETTAPLTGNMPGSIKSGTVGVPMPGTTVRISDDGEVLAQGIGVFAGYTNPDDNADAFTDGFFRTGDLGSLDNLGRITLKGRIKDVIVTAGGKTISPSIWEGYVETEPLIAHAVMVGEGKPFLGCLVLIDPEAVKQWASSQGITDASLFQPRTEGSIDRIRNGLLFQVVLDSVSSANKRVARSEQVKEFLMLSTDLGENSELLTPTLKLKRSKFLERANGFVNELYASAKR